MEKPTEDQKKNLKIFLSSGCRAVSCGRCYFALGWRCDTEDLEKRKSTAKRLLEDGIFLEESPFPILNLNR